MDTIPAKNIIFRAKNPNAWFGAEYNMNIYRGCSHGCIYCDSRSTCYRNPNFDKTVVKENALEIIRNDLRRKIKHGVIATGAMSDPYNPYEKDARLTRNALELINAYGFGVAIDTKSTLVKRDIDILRDIKSHSPAIIKLTITTSDNEICKKVEPYAPNAQERFSAIKELSQAGIFSGVLMMPILPFINDTEENILQLVIQAKDAGARFIYPAFGMTLREGNREYYYRHLDMYFPGIKDKYIQIYGNRYNCTSPNAKKLWLLFKNKCDQLGLLYTMKDIISAHKTGYGNSQISFFE